MRERPHVVDEPEEPLSDEELAELHRAIEENLRIGDAWEKPDRVEDDTEEGSGASAGPPSVLQVYIARGSVPTSWNRRTRWTKGCELLPNPPRGAGEHVVWVWNLIYARLMKDGWAVCRELPKQEPAWYVDSAKVLAREAVVHHISYCHRGCSEAAWMWLLEKTDKTPVLDKTPPPSPGGSRE